MYTLRPVMYTANSLMQLGWSTCAAGTPPPTPSVAAICCSWGILQWVHYSSCTSAPSMKFRVCVEHGRESHPGLAAGPGVPWRSHPCCGAARTRVAGCGWPGQPTCRALALLLCIMTAVAVCCDGTDAGQGGKAAGGACRCCTRRPTGPAAAPACLLSTSCASPCTRPVSPFLGCCLQQRTAIYLQPAGGRQRAVTCSRQQLRYWFGFTRAGSQTAAWLPTTVDQLLLLHRPTLTATASPVTLSRPRLTTAKPARGASIARFRTLAPRVPRVPTICEPYLPRLLSPLHRTALGSPGRLLQGGVAGRGGPGERVRARVVQSEPAVILHRLQCAPLG